MAEAKIWPPPANLRGLAPGELYCRLLRRKGISTFTLIPQVDAMCRG